MAHGRLTDRVYPLLTWYGFYKARRLITYNVIAGPHHVVLSVVFHDVTRFSFQCCDFWETFLQSKDQQLTHIFSGSLTSGSFPPKPMRLRTNDLVEYFEKLYRAGGEFQHPDYQDDQDADLWTWEHKPTGIRVWRDAIDLTKGHGGEVYFHYTSDLAFRNITHPAKEAAEIWASLRTSGEDANAWWGKGIYTVPKPPDQWENRGQLLDNNFRNMMKRDSKHPERGPEYVAREPFLLNTCCIVFENCRTYRAC